MAKIQTTIRLEENDYKDAMELDGEYLTLYELKREHESLSH